MTHRYATSGFNIFSAIGKGVGNVLSSDVVQKVAAGALALYGVPPGITERSIELAGGLVQRAARGEPRAVQAAANIEVQAARGVPAARRASAAIRHARRSQSLAALAARLLEQIERGDPRAQRSLQQIADRARQGIPEAATAAKAVREVLAASWRTRTGQPPPPVVARRPPPPPAASAAARRLPARPVATQYAPPIPPWMRRPTYQSDTSYRPPPPAREGRF